MRISDWSSDVCSSDLLPTVTTETGAIDDLYLKIVFLEHLSRNYELRIKVLLLRTIIGDRDAAEITRRSLAPPFSLEHILDREVETIRGRNSRVLQSAAAQLHPGPSCVPKCANTVLVDVNEDRTAGKTG